MRYQQLGAPQMHVMVFTKHVGMVDEILKPPLKAWYAVEWVLRSAVRPWHTLGHVDSVIYGAPRSGLTRRQILEKYQVYGDSVLRKYGQKPHVRDVVKPLLHLFYSEPGNGLWKRKADAAFQNCTSIKSFFEETLVAIPDSVMDSPVAEPPSGRDDLFADIHSLLPPPYKMREQEVLYA
ncbi:trna-dihydrouridine(20/20a) synthase [Fagus crenata]